MSLGESDKRAADPGPTSGFGSERALARYHGEPGRPGDVEVVHTLLDEVPGMGKLIAPCLIEVGARNEEEPSVTAFVLLAPMPLSIHAFPRPGFVSADVFTCPDPLDDERIRGPLIATFKLGEVESNLIPRGTGYPLVDLDGPSLSGAPGSG